MLWSARSSVVHIYHRAPGNPASACLVRSTACAPRLRQTHRDHADLSYAKPFTSLGYVTVCILSVLWLGERIAPLQIVGIVIVVTGVWCVSMTPRATLPPREAGE